MLTTPQYRLLSLAAAVHCLTRVDAVARGGSMDEGELTLLSDALLSREADAIADVFPHPERYADGLQILGDALAGSTDHSAIVKYLINVLDLVQRLKKSSTVQQRLAQLLDGVPRETNTPPAEPIGEVYENTIATLGRRIQVTGDPTALQNPGTAALIRTLLLGAIRFAWLWEQGGGRRWHLIWRRKRILNDLAALQQRL